MVNQAALHVLLNKLCQDRLTACEYRIVLCIASYTLLLDKEYTHLSHGFLSSEAVIDESDLKKRIKALELKGIIKNFKEPGEIYNLWGINPKYIYNFSIPHARIGATSEILAEPSQEVKQEEKQPKAEPMRSQEEKPKKETSRGREPIKRSCTSATEEKSTLAPGTKTKTKARASK